MKTVKIDKLMGKKEDRKFHLCIDPEVYYKGDQIFMITRSDTIPGYFNLHGESIYQHRIFTADGHETVSLY